MINKPSQSYIRTLSDQRTFSQRQRIRLGNRIFAAQEGSDQLTRSEDEFLRRRMDEYQRDEDEATALLVDAVQDLPIAQVMLKIKGLGATLVAKIISVVDIERSDTISSLWKYCGYGLNAAGERDRPRKGEKLVYNAALRKDLYLVAVSFLRSHSPYANLYYNYKDEYQARGLTKGHAHMAAIRRMNKVFLSHLWLNWRMMENLPISLPYVHERLGHTHFHDPADYGWPYGTEDIMKYLQLQLST